MDVTIHGHDIKVTENMDQYTRQKVQKLTRYLPNITAIHAEYTGQKSSRGPDIVIAQITVRHSRGAILRAEDRVEMGEGNAAEVALNGAIDKMYRRIRRFKGKRKSKNRRVRERYMATVEELEMAEAMPGDEIPAADAVAPEEYAGEFDEPEIIRRKEVAITAMHEEEAIEQMELLGHTFFVFFNIDSNQMNVVYRRETGGYGLLIPQVE